VRRKACCLRQINTTGNLRMADMSDLPVGQSRMSLRRLGHTTRSLVRQYRLSTRVRPSRSAGILSALGYVRFIPAGSFVPAAPCPTALCLRARSPLETHLIRSQKWADRSRRFAVALMPVADALAAVLAGAEPLAEEMVALDEAHRCAPSRRRRCRRWMAMRCAQRTHPTSQRGSR
jgi:hypothetical protein